MGKLVSLATAKTATVRQKDARWDKIFGSSSKEDSHRVGSPRRGYRTLDSTDASLKRLIEAMRSNAPGTWTDDRFEQARHFCGVPYIAIHRMAMQWQQAEFAVFRRDRKHPDGKVPVTEDDPPEGDRTVRPYDLVKLMERPNGKDSFGKMLYRVCLPPGSRVRMADGSQKLIEQIKLNDRVLTAEGNISDVVQTMVNPHNGELVNVKLWGHNCLRLTANHEVLTRRGYVPAGKLTKDDWVVVPRYRPIETKVLQTAVHVAGETTRIFGRNWSKLGQKVPSTGGQRWPGGYKRVPDFLDLTPGFGRILGLYLAEGHTTKAGRTCWTFNVTELDTLVADLVQLLKEELGLTATIKTDMNVRGTAVLVYVGGKLWTRLFESLCGKYAYGKRIHQDLLGGPDDFLKSLFFGWMDGDGCRKSSGKVVGATVSHELALNMFDVANCLGLRPTLFNSLPKNKNDGINRRQVWRVGVDELPVGNEERGVAYEQVTRLRQDGLGSLKISRIVKIHPQVLEGWFRNSQPRSADLENGKMWRRVREIQREPYKGVVYNFGVAGDNSYVAEGIGVHNCQQKYLSGSALIWMLPNKLGTPMELYVIPTATAVPQAAINEQYPNGYYRIQPFFPYGPFSSYPTPTTSVGAAIPAEWILDIRFPHPLVNYDGWSPLTAGRLQFDEIESIDRSRWYKMKRSTNPSAVMNFKEMVGAEPLPEPELDRIHSEWENEQEGPENHGKLIVMPPGGELSEWGARPADMEYQAGWSQLVDFGMALIGMTKPAAGMLDTSSYATLFAALKQVHLLVLKPDLEDVAQQFTHRVAPFYGDDLIVEIRCPRIDDDSIKQQKWSILCQNKACKINELRKAYDEPLIEEEWGESRVGEDPQGMMQAASQPMEEAMVEQGMVPQEEGGPPGPPELSGQEEQLGGPPQPPELRGPGTGKLGEGSLGPRMGKRMPNDLRRFALLPEQEEEESAVSKSHLLNILSKKLSNGDH